MELTAEMFEQTIRLFKGDGAAMKNQRRVHPRVGIRCRIPIIPVEGGVVGQTSDVWTRDISRTGIGVLAAQKMKVGSRFVVKFPRPDQKPLALVCTIKCCTQIATGVFAIGAIFEGLDKTATAAA